MDQAIPIEIKDRHIFDSLIGWLYHHKLRKLIYWLNGWCDNITITEGYREARHKGDVHATVPVRAIDIRSWRLKNPQAVADKINKNWVYDPQRPEMKCCVYGDEAHKDHFHIQVHPKTEFVGKSDKA